MVEITDTTALNLDTVEQSLTVLAGYLEGFLEQWEAGGEPPLIADAVPAGGDLRRVALVELIKIDLEYRWGERNLPKRIDDYLAEFPELSEGGVPADLIYEEYHLRKQCGLNVSVEEYLERFPEQARELQCLLGLNEPYSPTAMLNESKKRVLDDVEVGQQLDDFHLLAHLGKGAFASVFLARQESMQRLVALKISADYGTEPQTLAQLDHDHIVRVYDLRTIAARGLRLLYMQYVAGGTLQAVVKGVKQLPASERSGHLLLDAIDDSLEERGESRPIESSLREKIAEMSWPDAVCWIGGRLAEALDYAHRLDVLHRDVKPANVLLTADGVPKLADFNISFSSKLAGASPATYFGGSLAYMPPEQLEASNPAHERTPDSLDGRSDVYALGVVLWELLTGERPFRDDVGDGRWINMLQAMTERRWQGLENSDLESLPPDCPEGLKHALEKCLAADPEDRWQSGWELARHLDLCRKPRARMLLYPSDTKWHRWSTRYIMLIGFLIAAVPNVLAGIFNFFYNRDQIVPHLEDAATSFWYTQLVINSTAYPFGLTFGMLLLHSVTSTVKELHSGRNIAPQRLYQVRRRALALPHYFALIGVVLWIVAGVAYPVTLHFATDGLTFAEFMHFFGSLLICGLVAASYPFFGMAHFSLKLLYPRLMREELTDTSDTPRLGRLSNWAWFYLVLAAAVPLLGVTALSFIESDTDMSRWALRLLGVVGFLGLGLLLPVFRILQSDLSALEDAAGETAK